MNNTDAPTGSASLREAGLFSAMLVLSGFCGISYEILYSRLLGNLIGDQMAVSASILMTFLLGIGIGTRFAWKLWKHLWVIEASIGVAGLCFAFGTPVLDSLLYGLMPAGGVGLGGAVVFCTALLAIPAFLIGCSLPLFAGYLDRISGGRNFSYAYALYNFGAAATVLLIEFSLVRVMGLQLTVVTIASVNVGVGLILFFRYRDVAAAPPEAASAENTPKSMIVALGLASLGSAVFQLLMVKSAQCLLGPFTETFAIVLAIVLLGVASGSVIVRRFQLTFTNLMFANLVGLLWVMVGMEVVARFYATLYGAASDSYAATVLLKFVSVLALMGLPSLTFGATIPALLTSHQHVARESGHLLFVSSLANALGFLLMAFVLHRSLDYGPILILITLLSAAAIVVHRWKHWRPMTGAAALAVTAWFCHMSFWQEDLLYLGHTNFHDVEDLEVAQAELMRPERFKGYQDVFSINWVDGRPYFFINGYTSIPLNSSSEKLVGAFSSIYAPRNDEALVLGVGSGATASTVGELFDSTDAVEINPVVLENLHRMSKYNFDIENNPRVRIIHDDAIHFTKASPKQYSLIINTVTTPLYFSSSKLYTSDFLSHIRQRLKPDGVYVTWVDSRVGDEGINITLRTISEQFKHCGLAAMKSSYFLLVCSQEPIRPHQPSIVADNPKVARHFMVEHELNPAWFRYGLLTDNALGLIGDSSVPVNSLDLPSLEFSMTRLRERGIPEFKKRLLAHMELNQAQKFFALKNTSMSEIEIAELAERSRKSGYSFGFDPYEMVLYCHQLLGDTTLTERWAKLVVLYLEDEKTGFPRADLKHKALRALITGDADDYRNYGVCLVREGFLQDGEAAYRKALEIEPQQNNTHFNLGSCYERMNNFEAALQEYKAELRVDPDDEDVAFRLGRVLVRLGRYEQALESLREALAHEEDSETWLLQGQALEQTGRRELALEAYRKATTITPIEDGAIEEFARLSVALARDTGDTVKE